MTKRNKNNAHDNAFFLPLDGPETPDTPIDETPTPADFAELAEVEAELDQRWPETKIEPSLARISALMELLGAPQHSFPSIHIAGTNGKTSVSRMIDALLTRLGQRTGRTTSPHLQLVTERINVDNAPLSPRRYIDTYRELKPYIGMIDQQSEAAGGPRMSKFEVLTAIAFSAFADAPVDVGIIEVGLGGRWDATNVVNGQVAVITPISTDHIEYLGPDLTSIAAEKAGIIKKAPEKLIPTDTVAIIARQEPEVMEVLLRQAVASDAAVAREGSEFNVMLRQVAVGGQQLTLQGLGGVYEDVFLPLHGEHQARNAATALAAVEAFFGAGRDRQLDIDAVREAFMTVTSPGRLERVRAAPTVFLDAAHNPDGARALAAALTSEFDFRRLIGIVAVMADKDASGILDALEPVFDEIVVTTNGSPRAMHADELAALALARFGEDRVIVSPDLANAIEVAVARAEDTTEPGEQVSGAGIVITGSVVTAGTARTLFGREPA
ncbi:bifunctional folylpolyglutamate synthase/dihydrofolate synthase [Hoyosella sp. YIM 151337]|uniref:bifunctional tetrahydrofolate synthase/dihydrofolate synthase n=1 Tax=Hoyosella sp. YIM 151337 TaxID=2992742 RepID=UPI0022366691|nr:folylpolyglutamate synthase/dihydrofolate synthase family protein [Hoyosella sp. YIM 151337]MCW4355246.1 bifunctional folylpolyglutamate synthase/dihydrofolate synthase [Hoyosella sp. YIM 151337]